MPRYPVALRDRDGAGLHYVQSDAMYSGKDNKKVCVMRTGLTMG
jgi:hypothetical protein